VGVAKYVAEIAVAASIVIEIVICRSKVFIYPPNGISAPTVWTLR